jgi:hypothetical protein
MKPAWNAKKGAVVTLVAVFLSLLFPIIQFSVIDIGSMYIVKEQLKYNVQSAVSGAVTLVDWEETYYGNFRLDVTAAADALHTCLELNLDPASAGAGGEAQFLGSAGTVACYRGTAGRVSYYAEVFNTVGEMATLGGNRIPAEYGTQIEVRAVGPTVFLIAEYEYPLAFLSAVIPMDKDISLVQYASAALRSTDYEIN